MDEPQGSANDTSGVTEATAEFNTTIVDFEQPATLVGQKLDGRFMIEKNLADTGADTGGIGLVYLAKDMKLMGKEVVVKILREAALKHEDIVRKFLHEKEALIRLDHPGIVRILDSGTLTDGNPFMVMEFIEGHSLRKELQKAKQLPLDVAAHVIESVTDALSAAHSKNILHRDIKPENIMLTPQEDGAPRVRIIDFGIARVGESQLAPATEISRAIGTILYIAPEQLIGKLDIAGPADIYAAAIVAYEMLIGELPFKPKAIAEMYLLEQEGVKTRPSQLRPDLPAEAERVLLSALEFDPEKRPQNARAFGRDLARALRNESPATAGGLSSDTDEDLSGVVTEVITKVTPHDFDNNETRPQPRSWLKWALTTVIVFAIISIPGGYFAWKALKPATTGGQTATSPQPADSAVQHELSYFLMVQKMRDKKPFESPFKSSGQEVFESGYKFSMTFQPDSGGYMYVFNEGNDEHGNTGYFLLFPTPSANGGSSQVKAGQQIETGQNTFNGGLGTEVMWLIWTKEKRDDLEAATRSAIVSGGGAVKDIANVGSLQSFLKTDRADKPESIKDSANQRTLVKAKGDTVAYRFELEHR